MKEENDEKINRRSLGEKADEEHLYIWNGGYSQRVYLILSEHNIEVAGYIVTNNDNCDRQHFSLPVHCAETMDYSNILLIIGTNRRNTIEIKEFLSRETNCSLENVILACEYFENRRLDDNYYKRPTIDVTTVIGCKVNCKFCPQSLLISRYFENNPDRERILSMDVFRKCLSHLPHECNIAFCGMSEPFLNKNCSDMILEAVNNEKHVELYTTLVGATLDDIKKIWDFPIDYVNIHLSDRNGNAKIPVTDEYLQLLTEVLEHNKKDGTSFVNECSSQGEPCEEVNAICRDKFDIYTVLHDRAGNLGSSSLIHKENKFGRLSCTQCGQEYNRNILLPDGTVVLCCMDYGLKHVLGNLTEQTYEEIIQGEEMALIKQGIMGDEGIDILCRRCSFAHQI